jgi:hypothetical protein
VIPLRPLGVGDILDGAVAYLRANPRVTLGLSAVVALVGQVLIQATRLMDQPSPAPLATAGSAGFGRFLDLYSGGDVTQIVSIVVGLGISAVLTGMLIPVVAGAVLGRRSTVRDVRAMGGSRIAGLLMISLLTLLRSVLAYVVVFMVGMLGASALIAVDAPMWSFWAVGALLFAVALFVAAYLWVAWSLAPAVYVLEDVSVREALHGSSTLVRGVFWRVFGILVLGHLIAGLISGLLTFLPVGAGAVALIGSASTTTVVVAVVLATVGGIVTSAITTPFLAGVTGLLYVDQRIRREGLDIRLGQVTALDGVTVREAFRGNVPPAPQPPDAGTEFPRAS